VLRPLAEYPHVPGGYDRPFEAVFVGWAHGLDPHDPLWHSRSISSPENPAGLNFMGFSDPRVDALLDEGIATYDRRERARIYRTFQRLLAEQHAVLFGWASRVYEAVDARLTSIDGELDLSSSQWFWQLEKLVLRDDPALTGQRRNSRT
jgi:ABC-type transport system substrate-binding protein